MKRSLTYIIICFIFIACNNQTEIKQIKLKKAMNYFIGNWESTERCYPYKGFLLINKNGSFNFNYGACMASGVSEGKWELKDNIIILNSIKTDSCLYLSYFDVDCILEVEFVDEEDFIQNYSIETTIKDCEPKYYEDYVLFNNEEFYISNDTLVHISKKKTCPEIKNDFTRITRNNADTK